MTTLYSFYDEHGRILYVGISHRLASRFSEHKREKPWPLVARIDLRHYETREEALVAEVEVIKRLSPPWNVRSNNGAPSSAEYLPSSPLNTSGGLPGHFFHSFSEHDDGCRTVATQGCIAGQVEPGFYIVQYFGWFLGEELHRSVVGIEEMTDWHFYEDAEEMKCVYEIKWAHENKAHAEHKVGVERDQRDDLPHPTLG